MLDSPLLIMVRYRADRRGTLYNISLTANDVVFNIYAQNCITKESYGDYICTLTEPTPNSIPLLGVLADPTMLNSVDKVNQVTLVDGGGNDLEGFQLREIQLYDKDHNLFVKVDPKVIAAFESPVEEAAQFDCVNIPHEFDLNLTATDATALRHALNAFFDSRECIRKVPKEERDLLTEIYRKIGG